MSKVKMTTNKGVMEIELYDKDAPNTVKNFVELIEKGYYDGVIFHRVIDEFVVQGGDPTGKGTGGPGYKIACETKNQPPPRHEDGALSMAHAGPSTGGSQFFIVLSEKGCKHLDGGHTVFGKVTSGMDVVFKITQGDKMEEVVMLEVDEATKNATLQKM
ncbi:MAG: peptidylprolyl isomerase [Candidatus Heimdallarchaeota archaeon]|nr:peptidylprolyl isomerase [Candidatus Heimdallarchaeota archaeon]MCK5048327.1 peptidylprolyl isomerase [Candidatus Heimdallarchaeota archaeon]